MGQSTISKIRLLYETTTIIRSEQMRYYIAEFDGHVAEITRIEKEEFEKTLLKNDRKIEKMIVANHFYKSGRIKERYIIIEKLKNLTTEKN